MRDMRGEQEEEEERGGGVAKGCKRMTRCDSAGSAGGKKKSAVITHGPKTLQAWQKQETGKEEQNVGGATEAGRWMHLGRSAP